MTQESYDKIIDRLTESRGEAGCQSACDKLKSIFKVKRVLDIYEKDVDKILEKLELEIVQKTAEKVFGDDVEQMLKCPQCEKELFKQGMFYICTECRKIVE